MGTVLEFLRGKKTYIIAAAIIVVTALKSYGVDIPDEVWAVLAALGLGFIRAGVKKTEDAVDLIE